METNKPPCPIHGIRFMRRTTGGYSKNSNIYVCTITNCNYRVKVSKK